MGKAGGNFKKPTQKKSFTKKDIRAMAIIGAIIAAVVVVLAIVISTDDFLRVENGLVQMEDNWLVADFSRTGASYQYYQVGELGDVEGFTLGEESAYNDMKYLHPAEEDGMISVIYVGATRSNYAEMANYLAEGNAANFGVEYYEPTDISMQGMDGLFVYCVLPDEEELAAEATTEPEATEAPAEEDAAAEETDEDSVTVIGYGVFEYDDEHCIYVQVNGDSTMTEEIAREYIRLVGESLTVIEH